MLMSWGSCQLLEWSSLTDKINNYQKQSFVRSTLAVDLLMCISSINYLPALFVKGWEGVLCLIGRKTRGKKKTETSSSDDGDDDNEVDDDEDEDEDDVPKMKNGKNRVFCL